MKQVARIVHKSRKVLKEPELETRGSRSLNARKKNWNEERKKSAANDVMSKNKLNIK